MAENPKLSKSEHLDRLWQALDEVASEKPGGAAMLRAKARAFAREGAGGVARKWIGLTQAEFGDACGVTQAAVSQWESGARVPRGSVALRYAMIVRAINLLMATETDAELDAMVVESVARATEKDAEVNGAHMPTSSRVGAKTKGAR